MKRKYYTAIVPFDFPHAGESLEQHTDARFQQAIAQARESFRNYVMPCRWRKIWDRGDQVRIVRESN